jgi:peptidoglycan/xylan/chitin deacetylase (PgdA/CDA1 family)
MTFLTVVEIIAAGAIALGCALYYACAVVTSQTLGRSLVRGPADRRAIALTFDDGPATPFTDQILDTLRKYNVPGTFFVCGKNVERHPETLRRIHAEKHSIGNHTYSHPFLCLKSRRRIAEEIDRTQAAIEESAGRVPGSSVLLSASGGSDFFPCCGNAESRTFNGRTQDLIGSTGTARQKLRVSL